MDFPNGQDGNYSSKPDKNFSLWYMGWSSLDRRTTLPMLPWLVAEIRRKSEKNELGPVQAREVDLIITPPIIRCVPANNNNSSIFIFEHKAQCISRFIHNSHDLKYFAYLIRSQPEDPESEMACHVFKACDPNQVSSATTSHRGHCLKLLCSIHNYRLIAWTLQFIFYFYFITSINTAIATCTQETYKWMWSNAICFKALSF